VSPKHEGQPRSYPIYTYGNIEESIQCQGHLDMTITTRVASALEVSIYFD
jgi:hypothetical protein